MARRKTKNIGRVKRYNHNFYATGRHYWAKRICVGILVLALLFVLGVFAAPAVLDWGSHFWYTVVKDQETDPVATPTPPAATAAPDENPAPDGTAPETPSIAPEAPAQADPALAEGSFQVLRLSALQTADALAKTAQDLHDRGVRMGIVPLKDESGFVYYPSAVPQAAASIAATTIDPAAVAQALKAQGVRPAAAIAAFKDPMVDRELGIRYVGMDYMWLDNKAEAGGKRWMNPYAPAAVQYIGDLIQEVRDMGFETILLTGVQFPRQESAKQDFGDTQGRDRAAQLQADIAAWESRFAGSVSLVYEVPYESCVTASSTLGGAMPGALGMKQVVLRMPAPTEEGDPEASQVPMNLEEVAQNLRQGGVERIAVRNGVSGEILPQP